MKEEGEGFQFISLRAFSLLVCERIVPSVKGRSGVAMGLFVIFWNGR